MAIQASTEWAEQIPADEAARFEAYGFELSAMAQARAAATGQEGREFHLEQHVGVKAELIVGSLPDPELRVGPFAAPKSWPAYVRFSNGASSPGRDSMPDIRGVAIKLVGVPGTKLIPGLEQALTQDFLFIQIPATPVATPDEFMAIVRAGNGGPLWALPRLVSSLGLRKSLRLLVGALRMPRVTSMAAGHFFTAAPLRFGDRAVKLDLVPQVRAPRHMGKGPDALRNDLIERLSSGPIRYQLRAQFYVDEKTTPIEDASVVWPTPFYELGELVIPAQDVGSASGQAIDDYVESLSFNPWHALVELRPLGAMMRARGPAYREGALQRGAVAEPDGSEGF